VKKKLFFLLVLVPQLMYASFETHACTKALERIDTEWIAHVTLLMQFEALPKTEKIDGLPLLKQAIECCQRAISHCDYILSKIEHKSKRERQQHYWSHVKEECKQYKTGLFQEIEKLNGLTHMVITNVAFVKSNAQYEKGVEKANLANKMRQECPRRLNNVEEVVAMLNQAIDLYEEAATFVVEALDLVVPFPDEESKQIIKETLNVYKKAIQACHQEISEWPLFVLKNVVELKEKFNLLVAERELAIQKADAEELLKIEEQLIPLIQELVECSEEDVTEELKKLISK
jgi:hypothetical protein